jgi:hypothetical protein
MSGGSSTPRVLPVPGGRDGRSFRDSGITKVAGIEARGFILGAAVALELRAWINLNPRFDLFLDGSQH